MHRAHFLAIIFALFVLSPWVSAQEMKLPKLVPQPSPQQVVVEHLEALNE